MSKKVKKIILPGTALIVSSYVSILFAIGIIIGYLGTNLFQNKFVKTGKLKLIILTLGKWKIHFHHWIIGSLIILIAYIMNFLSSLPIFCLGIVGGLIFHDFYTDKTWYKIVYKSRTLSRNEALNPVRDSSLNDGRPTASRPKRFSSSQ